MKKYLAYLILSEIVSGVFTASQTKIVCEDDSEIISCDDEKTISIISASYGREESRVEECDYGGTLVFFPGCTNDVRNDVMQNCQALSRCTLIPTDDTFGDPCELRPYRHYLEVAYECVSTNNDPDYKLTSMSSQQTTPIKESSPKTNSMSEPVSTVTSGFERRNLSSNIIDEILLDTNSQLTPFESTFSTRISGTMIISMLDVLDNNIDSKQKQENGYQTTIYIAVGVIAVVLVVLIILLVGICFYRRKFKSTSSTRSIATYQASRVNSTNVITNNVYQNVDTAEVSEIMGEMVVNEIYEAADSNNYENVINGQENIYSKPIK